MEEKEKHNSMYYMGNPDDYTKLQLPSSNQTWLWKMDHVWVIFLWKPPFIEDFRCHVWLPEGNTSDMHSLNLWHPMTPLEKQEQKWRFKLVHNQATIKESHWLPFDVLCPLAFAVEAAFQRGTKCAMVQESDAILRIRGEANSDSHWQMDGKDTIVSQWRQPRTPTIRRFCCKWPRQWSACWPMGKSDVSAANHFQFPPTYRLTTCSSYWWISSHINGRWHKRVI